MGTSRTTLVGRFERKESDTFLITFSIRFCLFSKVLNGGFTYMFFPVKSCLKKSCFAPNTLSSGYSENHSFRLDEWCSTSAMPSTSRQKCFCSRLSRDGVSLLAVREHQTSPSHQQSDMSKICTTGRSDPCGSELQRTNRPNVHAF